MPPVAALREGLGDTHSRFRSSAKSNISLDEVAAGSIFGDSVAELARRNVLVAAADQRAAAPMLIELDGIAARKTEARPETSATSGSAGQVCEC